MQLCPAYSFLLSSPRYIESSPLICSSDNHLISPAKLILINRQTCISFEYDIPTFSSLPAFFLCDFSRHLHKSTKDESDYDLLFVFPKFAKEVCIRYSINPPRYHSIKSYATHNGNCRSDLSWILMGRVKNRAIECKRRERSEKVVAHKDSLIDTIAQTTADLLSRYLHDHVIPRAHQHQEAHDSKRMHQMIKSVHRPHIQRATIESSSSDEQLPAVQLQDNQNVKIYKKHRSQSDRAQKKSDDIQKVCTFHQHRQRQHIVKECLKQIVPVSVVTNSHFSESGHCNHHYCFEYCKKRQNC